MFPRMSHPAIHQLKTRLPGLLLVAFLSGSILWLADLSIVARLNLGALTLAILCGMIVGNTCYPALDSSCQRGVLFAKQTLLRTGIILYGFRITLTQVAEIGFSGLLTDILVLSTTFALACWLGKRLFGLDRETCWLIGAGSSICGAAAILATEPVVKAAAEKVAVAVATVVLFGTIGTVIYPALYPLLHACFTPETFGVYMGSTLHEVAQVVAAGHAISPETENAAVITKMLRVMLLAPFLLFLALRVKHLTPVPLGDKLSQRKISIPWFAVLFLAVALLNSFSLFPPALVGMVVKADTFLLAMAMVALGLTTRFNDLKKAGARPLLLALILFFWLLTGGGVINILVRQLA